VGIVWNPWGTLPHFLPQRAAFESTAAALKEPDVNGIG
jgi:hypothetical protein